MEFKKYKAVHEGELYEIDEDYPEVGVYLFVYRGGKCIRDELQNSVNDCKELALENYGVPLEDWSEVDSIRGDS